MKYSTKDFYISAVIRSLGYEMTLDASNPRQVIFNFEDPKGELEETVRKYWSYDLQVEPRSVIESINELKTRMQSGF